MTVRGSIIGGKVQVERKNKIALVTMNRASKKNAFDESMRKVSKFGLCINWFELKTDWKWDVFLDIRN